MNMKKQAILAVAIWLAFIFADQAGNFFGFSTQQGIVGSGLFFGVMSVAVVYLQKFLTKSTDA